jgi:pyridoxal phosphate enzyme (YggS family)
LLEINIGQEESKSGLDRNEIYQMLEKVAATPSIRVRGLMAIPPICQNPGDNNKFFEEMCNLSVDITEKKYDNVCMEILSMGMSDDYADAIAHGSTMIRVGTAIFGARNYAV